MSTGDGQEPPTQILQQVLRFLSRVWYCIIVVKDNAPPIEQCRSLFGQSKTQPKKLLSIVVRIDGLVARKEPEKYHAFDIPPYRQENFHRMQTWFHRSSGHVLCTAGDPCSLSLDFLIANPFFVSSHNPLKNRSAVTFSLSKIRQMDTRASLFASDS